jgi:hypothetical protein
VAPTAARGALQSRENRLAIDAMSICSLGLPVSKFPSSAQRIRQPDVSAMTASEES